MTFISVYGMHYGRMTKLAEYTVGVTKPVLKFTKDLTYEYAALDPNDYITGLPEGQPFEWSIPAKSKTAWLSGDGSQILALKNGSVKVSCTIGSGKYAAKYTAALKVKIPKTPKCVKLKEGSYKTVTLKNVSSFTHVEWSCNEEEGILITEIPKNNKVRIYGFYPGETTLTATVDGREYVIPVEIR